MQRVAIARQSIDQRRPRIDGGAARSGPAAAREQATAPRAPPGRRSRRRHGAVGSDAMCNRRGGFARRGSCARAQAPPPVRARGRSVTGLRRCRRRPPPEATAHGTTAACSECTSLTKSTPNSGALIHMPGDARVTAKVGRTSSRSSTRNLRSSRAQGPDQARPQAHKGWRRAAHTFARSPAGDNRQDGPAGCASAFRPDPR